MGYDAFLSYSHAADGQLAPALQSGLQKFAKSWRQRKALNVFRDKTGLSANPGLWSSIQEVLDDTKYFVLLASPDAAASPWVNREIEYWKANKPPNTILPVLTDGELFWAEATNDFDRTRSTAAPEALSGAFSEEPLWADLRWAHGETDLSLRHTKFRDAVAELAAPMHGKPKDELEGEDVRQQRRTRRLVRGAVVVLAVLTVAAITASVFAVRNADRAEDRRKLAVSRQLAGQAVNNADDDLQQSFLLANESYNVAPTVEAEGAVFETFNEAPDLQAVAQVSNLPLVDVALVPDQDLLLTVGLDGTMVYWDTEEQTEIAREEGAHPRGAISMPQAADSRTVASVGPDGTVVLWDLDNPGVADTFKITGMVHTAALSPDGETLASFHEDGLLRLWDVVTGRSIAAPVEATLGLPGPIAFSPDGTQLATAGRELDFFIVIWDLTPEPVEINRFFHGRGSFTTALAFSGDGQVLASAGEDGLLAVRPIDTSEESGEPFIAATAQGHAGPITDLSFEGDTDTIASTAYDGRLILWDAISGTQYPERLRVRPVALNGVSSAGSELATAADDGTIAYFDTESPRIPAEIVDVGPQVQELTVSPDGRIVAVGEMDGVRFWDIEAGDWLDTTIDLGGPVDNPTRAFAVAFSPDGEEIAIGENLGDAQIYRVADGEPVGNEATINEEGGGVAYLAYSPDGTRIVSGALGGGVSLWAVEDGTFTNREELSEDFIGGVAINADGELAWGEITEDAAAEIARYDIDTGEELESLRPDSFVVTLEYDTTGELLAAGDVSGSISLWDVDDERLLGDFIGSAGLILGMTFLEDNTRLASGSTEGEVRLWDVESRLPVGSPFRGHDGDMGAFAGSATHDVVVSAGYVDNQMLIWDFDLEFALAENCDLAGRNLTREEWDQFLPDESYHVTCEQWRA